MYFLERQTISIAVIQKCKHIQHHSNMCGWWKRKGSPRQPVVGLAQAGADHPPLLRHRELIITQPLPSLKRQEQ